MEKSVPLWIRIALLAVLGVGFFWMVAAIGEVATVVVIAALLAYLFDPLCTLLEARGLDRTLATTVVFAGTSLILGALGVLFLPLVVAEVRAIQTGFDVGQARAAIDTVERWLEARLAVMGVEDLDILGTVQRFIVTNVTDVVTLVPNVVVLVTQLVILPFILFFFLKDGRRIKKGFINLVPNRYFEFTLNVLHKTDVQLGNYLRGQLIASSIVGLLSIAALWLLKVDYYVLIGLFAGLTNMIPYLGPITGATVAVLISVVTTGTFDTVLPILVSFALIQAIDNAGISPLVLARTVKMHPLLILLTLLIAGKLFGFLGLLLAVPVTAVFKVFAQEMITNLRSYRLA